MFDSVVSSKMIHTYNLVNVIFYAKLTFSIENYACVFSPIRLCDRREV